MTLPQLCRAPLKLLLFFFFPFSLVANDSSVGMDGEDVRLLSEGRVRMVSEDILIEQITPDEPNWKVEARYLFENLTPDTLHLLVGFPEPTMPGDDPIFGSFRVVIDGREISYTTARATLDSTGAQYGRTYVFEATFLPYERKEIQHFYSYHGSTLVAATLVHYVTTTGATWAGTIGQARFCVRTYVIGSPRPNLLVTPGLDLADFRLEPVLVALPEWVVENYKYNGEALPSRIYLATYVFEQSDWEPLNDFHIAVADATEPFDLCDVVDKYGYAEKFWVRNPDRLLDVPFDSAVSLLACHSDSTLRTVRNMIYAYYGRPFNDPSLHNQFYRRRNGSWFDDDEPTPNPEGYNYAFLPNTAYHDSLVTPKHRELASLLKRIEDARQTIGPPTARSPHSPAAGSEHR